MSDDPRLGPVTRRLAATQRVLCVEDEADVAGFLRAYFRASGYDLVHLDPDDTEDVMDALEEHRPDLVLLDMRLRGFFGSDAYRRMRSVDRWAFVPVVMVSADVEADPHFEPPRGIDAFVPKPFNTDSLAALVKDRIARAKELAAVGTDQSLQMFTQDYLEARLADEIALAGSGGAFAFALVQLQATDDVVAEVGDDGLDHLLGSLVARARELLPLEAVFGFTNRHELAVLLPRLTPRDAYPILRKTLDDLVGDFRFAGGAVVPVGLAGGLAAYPANAADPDGLFMAADSALAAAEEERSVLQIAL